MGTLLEHSRANEGEAVVSEAMVDKLVSLARLHTDKQLQADGLGIHLEEDINLELPFHVPEVGYYGDGLVGVPTGLQEYLESAVSAGGLRVWCLFVCEGVCLQGCVVQEWGVGSPLLITFVLNILRCDWCAIALTVAIC